MSIAVSGGTSDDSVIEHHFNGGLWQGSAMNIGDDTGNHYCVELSGK